LEVRRALRCCIAVVGLLVVPSFVFPLIHLPRKAGSGLLAEQKVCLGFVDFQMIGPPVPEDDPNPGSSQVLLFEEGSKLRGRSPIVSDDTVLADRVEEDEVASSEHDSKKTAGVVRAPQESLPSTAEQGVSGVVKEPGGDILHFPGVTGWPVQKEEAGERGVLHHRTMRCRSRCHLTARSRVVGVVGRATLSRSR
jgi:hypothetical protein